MTTKQSGIYILENLINGDFYLGSTCDFRERKCRHFIRLRKNIHDNIHLQRAYDKYGLENFEFKKILFCESFELLYYEQILLDKWNPSYNICKVAGNTLGCHRSEEAKKRISEKNKGRKHTEETKILIGKACKGRIFSKEHNEKISKARTGIPLSPDVVARVVATRKKNNSYVCSDEQKEKIRNANKGKRQSEEWHKKLMERISSPEWQEKNKVTLKKMSELRWATKSMPIEEE